MLRSIFSRTTADSPLYKVLRYGFTVKSQRDRVPNLMKDPRFTRTGMSKKKSKSYQYDLTQPHINYPERYYNEEVEIKEERRLYKERRREKRGLEIIPTEEARPIEHIIKDITRKDLILDGSSRIINNITELERNYPAQLKDENLRDLIVDALKGLTAKVHLKNFRELGIIASLNKKFEVKDLKSWENIMVNLIRFVRRQEHKTFDVFENVRLENNFIHILNSVIHASKSTGLDISILLELIDSIYANKTKEFKSIQNFILFVSSVSNVPSLKVKTEFWNAIEKEATSKLDKMNGIDALTLVHSFSKAKFNSTLIEKLIGKFVEKYPEINHNKIEKITVIATALANLKIKNEKFIIFAEKEVEANLDKLTPVDARFIVNSFPRLGIKSKNILQHCEGLIIKSKDQLNLKGIEQLMASTQGVRQFSKEYYNALGQRLDVLLEDVRVKVDKNNGEIIQKTLRAWNSLGLYKNEALSTKLASALQETA